MAVFQKIDISTSTIFRVVLILLGVWFVYAVIDVFIMLFAAFIIASVVEPIAKYMEKHKVPRAVTVIVFYIVLILFLAGLIGLTIGPLTYQIRQLATIVPPILDTLTKYLPLLPSFNRADIIESIQTGLLNFGGNIANFSSNVFAGTRSFVSGIVAFLFVFVIALYLVVEEDAVKKFAKLIAPAEHYPYVASAITRAQRSIGRWVLGQVALGVVIGLMVGIGLWVIGVPYALLFGILSAVLELIPVIGPLISAIPGVLVAFSQGWVIGLVAWVWYTIVGQVEGNILIPNIMRKAVGLPPIITIIAVIIGGRLFGIIGIIFAVPAATILKIIIADNFDADDELAG